MDPYSILGIAHDATDEQIIKAYRKKARKCHPDKNLDSAEEAAEKFKELQKALELLTDVETKSKYDLGRKAKEAARKRREELNRETKKAREELEAREKRVKLEQLRKQDELRQQNERKRLQAEGQRALEELQKQMIEKQKLASQRNSHDTPSTSTTSRGFQLVLRWSCDRSDSSKGVYTADLLRQLFSKYGEVTEVMVSSMKKGRGIVEFRTKDAAMVALEKETGLPQNPLKVKLGEQLCNPVTSIPSPAADTLEDRENLILKKLRQAQEKKEAQETKEEQMKIEDNQKDSKQKTTDNQKPKTASKPINRDLESIAMMRARQEAERQRLMEQMKNEDE